MPVTNENFDQLRIDKLKYFLENMAAKGQAKPYEIFVDNLKVVPKTEDPKDFESYEYYMSEDTEKIRILIYNSNLSPRNDQYSFFVQKNRQDKNLNGLGEIDNIIQEKLSARDKEYELNAIKEDLDKTKKLLEESEEYAEQLETELEEVKTNKYKLGNINMGELASIALEGIVRRNPQFISKLPGGETLAGIIEQDNLEKQNKQATVAVPEGEASFQKRTVMADEQSEEQKRYAAYLSHLEQVFNEQQLADVMQIIQKLAEVPTQVEPVKQLLQI